MGAGKARGMDDIIYCDVILLFMYKKQKWTDFLPRT